MDTGEFKIEQVEREVDPNDFNEVTQTDTVKHVPCKVSNVFSKCGSYDECHRETDLVDYKNVTYSYQDQSEENFDLNKHNPEYVDPSEICEDVSTDECNAEQIKDENNIDIFYEDIKHEIGEESSSELFNFCEVCNNRSSSETEFIDSKNNWFECSCQMQNDSVNLEGQDVKPSSLILSTDFGLHPFLKDENPEDLVLSERNCLVSANNDVFAKPQMTKSNGLEIHEMFHTEEKPFQCEICSKTFKERRYLKAHESTHTGEKPFHCKICSKTFKELRHLKGHESTHTVKKPFHCEICSKTFIMTSSNFNIHKRIHTKLKTYYCKICSKYFRSLRHLKIHEKTHAGEEPFYCKICSMTFIMNLNNFKIHERIHTGERPFHCKICSKYFSSLQILKAHERTHKKEKLYCKICSKYFKNLQNLKFHERFHTGKNPYLCQICSNSFTTLQNKKIHEKTHTEETPFCCKICSKYFSNLQNLKLHEIHHTRENPPPCRILPSLENVQGS